MQSFTRRLLLSLFGLGAGVAATAAWAHPPAPRFRLDLETETGQRLRRYPHAGTTFVLGTPGQRYSIRITNPTAERVEAVVTVDGRDAISGRRGNYLTERGYIVPPYGSISIDGFRSSLEEVRTFRFVDASGSYSARMGTPENVGIVGVAIFKERRVPQRPPTPYAAREEESVPRDASAPRKSSAPAPATESRPARSKAPAAGESPSQLGTEYGEARDSRVVETPFVRRSPRPDTLLSVRYDDADGLTARGIDLYPEPARPVRYEPPRAFPDSRFAPP